MDNIEYVCPVCGDIAIELVTDSEFSYMICRSCGESGPKINVAQLALSAWKESLA